MSSWGGKVEVKSKVLRVLFLFFGFVSFGLAIVGIVVPLLPAFPFFMLASFCFLKSSPKINNWFENTKLYNTYFKPFKENRAMTVKTKLSILIPVYIALGVLFFTYDILPMRVAIVVLLTLKTIVFIRIKTIDSNGKLCEGKE